MRMRLKRIEEMCGDECLFAGPHYDGSFIDNFNYRSLKTFNLYLNADFTGGTTNFIKGTDCDEKEVQFFLF